ncbi:hypothetical protein [Streptomyces sp. NPDC054854]
MSERSTERTGPGRSSLDDVRAVLGELGIGPADLTREQYTDAVKARRES